MKDLCVLIPSYNEAKTIGAIVTALKGRGLDVYIVDDGSTDGTANAARGQGAIVIRNLKNLGKGSALRVGIKRVLQEKYTMVLFMDGDDQHDTTDIAHLIKKMRESDAHLVIGNRMQDTALMPKVRIWVNQFMSRIISKVARQHVPDTQCGFRLIKREVLSSINLESSNYEIESEMILKTAKAGFKIESCPIRTVYHNEKSRINPIIDTARFLWFMLKNM